MLKTHVCLTHYKFIHMHMLMQQRCNTELKHNVSNSEPVFQNLNILMHNK